MSDKAAAWALCPGGFLTRVHTGQVQRFLPLRPKPSPRPGAHRPRLRPSEHQRALWKQTGFSHQSGVHPGSTPSRPGFAAVLRMSDQEQNTPKACSEADSIPLTPCSSLNAGLPIFFFFAYAVPFL